MQDARSTDMAMLWGGRLIFIRRVSFFGELTLEQGLEKQRDVRVWN
jgi:hypothetical protein